MSDYIVIAGTTEARIVIEALTEKGFFVTAAVATRLGAQALDDLPDKALIRVETGRKNSQEFTDFIIQENPAAVIDASHPFAVEVSKTVMEACALADRVYIRYIRPELSINPALMPQTVDVDNAGQAAAYLNTVCGNVLLTTGTNTVGAYVSGIRDFNRRCYVRVLQTPESVQACQKAGVDAAHVISMNPPFSVADNVKLLKEKNIDFLVTKDSGQAGGFPEKLMAAKAVGAGVIIIRRPRENLSDTQRADSLEKLLVLLGLSEEDKA